MPLPSPNLDDRTFHDIVEEAIRLIPQYCPDWTNFNPSDPGITLIEMFSWMTELILYRLNKVPDKVYVTLLDLIGVKLRAPLPARAMLTFHLVEGAEAGQWVPRGTQVATEQTEAEEPVIFESAEDLHVTHVKLVRGYSIDQDRVSDHAPFIDAEAPSLEGFDVFRGVKQIDRFLYLGDERFQALAEGATVQVIVTTPQAEEEVFTDLIEWEYWNGRRWRDLVPTTIPESEAPKGKGVRGVSFRGPLEDIAPSAIDEVETTWLRARLVEVPASPRETVIGSIKATAMIIELGALPEAAVANVGQFYVPLDQSKSFQPFGEIPEFDAAFYLKSQETFSPEDSQIRIECRLTDPSTAGAPNASPDMILRWEYWNGTRWAEIAATTPQGPVEPVGYNFQDTTAAFTKDGYITFLRPKDLTPVGVNQDEGWWVRARIDQGDYGRPGRYEMEDQNWVWKEDRPLRPPKLKSVELKYHQVPYKVKFCKTYNDFTYRDCSDAIGDDHRTIQAFEPIKEENPALYLGFDRAFPDKPISLYFRMEEQEETSEAILEEPLAEEGLSVRKRRARKADQRVVWEYWNGHVWTELAVADGTRNFTESGIVRFLGPQDIVKKREFGDELIWARARLEMGSYAKPPKAYDLRLNTVGAINAITLRNEILGHSDGTPDQEFSFAAYPVLKGQKIMVREGEVPGRKEKKEIILEEGEDAVRIVADPDGNPREVWIRWHEVESFYRSGPRSRHYVVDPLTGKIRFGDGVRGMIPPPGAESVVAEEYRTGGGTAGNVGARAISVMRQSIAYIESVTNYYPAGGGADKETIDEAKLRGPEVVRNRYRAVTVEDYEWLALKASGNVARAKCVQSPVRAGEVQVIVIPKEDQVVPDLRKRPVPTPELLRQVKDFLDERRLITTRLRVTKPRWVEISLSVEVVLKPVGAKTDWLRREIERQLRQYMHPLRGGPDGEGWPFGRSIIKSDLYHVVEALEGVDYVETLKIVDEDRQSSAVKIDLAPDELPYVVDVAVREMAKERMV